MLKLNDTLFAFDDFNIGKNVVSFMEAVDKINPNDTRDLPIEINGVLNTLDSAKPEDYSLPVKAIALKKDTKSDRCIVDIDVLGEYMGSNGINSVEEAVDDICEENDITSMDLVVGIDSHRLSEMVIMAQAEQIANPEYSVKFSESHCDDDDDDDDSVEFVPNDYDDDDDDLGECGIKTYDARDHNLSEQYFTEQLKAYGVLFKMCKSAGVDIVKY